MSNVTRGTSSPLLGVLDCGLIPLLFWRGSQKSKALTKYYCLTRCSSPSPCAPPSRARLLHFRRVMSLGRKTSAKPWCSVCSATADPPKNYVSVHCGSSSDDIPPLCHGELDRRTSSMSGHSKVSHWRRRIRCVQTHFQPHSPGVWT